MISSHKNRPKKSLGQHFLVQEGVLEKIVRTAELSRDDTVLEIGPGTGNLTRKLAEKAGRVIAVEKDRNMIPSLRHLADNVEVMEGDALEQVPQVAGRYTKVVANIPYYITGRLLRVLLKERFSLLVLLLQKEVAKRICATPPSMNLLAVSVQAYGAPSVEFSVSKGSFSPPPTVDSAVVKIIPHKNSLPREHAFFTIVRAGFSHPRKQLAGNLLENIRIERKVLQEYFKELDIKPTARAQELSLSQWHKLSEVLSPYL